MKGMANETVSTLAEVTNMAAVVKMVTQKEDGVTATIGVRCQINGLLYVQVFRKP